MTALYWFKKLFGRNQKRPSHLFTTETARLANKRKQQLAAAKKKVEKKPSTSPKKSVLTEDGRRRISEAVSRQVEIDGVKYRSIKQAAESIGLPRHQIKMVLKGTNSVSYYRKRNIDAEIQKRLQQDLPFKLE
jgi:glycyl-tRNA synthetase (class II)